MAKMKTKLGDTIIKLGFINQDQLMEGLEYQKYKRAQGESKMLGEALLELEIITKHQLLESLGEQMSTPHIDLETAPIEKDAILCLTKEMAQQFHVIPVSKKGDELLVAMANPQDIFAIDAIEEMSNMEITQYVAYKGDIEDAIEKYYSDRYLSGSRDINNAPSREISAVQEVDFILEKAIEEEASDIHIEAEATITRVRYRIDGMLHEVGTYPAEALTAMVSRIKVMAKLDITEKRIPQDGRIEFDVVDLRVSTLPTVHGEKVVIRILNKNNVKVSLETLGFQGELLEDMLKLIKRPNGVFFVTGPTGSGKTSTLYASVNEINTLEKNIITLEDPVEYQLDIINQVQVNPKTGMTFAKGLRAALRQDPDVLMIGEIRDLETAEIAIESAMTGHLVFSTLHTNSAIGSVTRLIDMGVKPFLLSATLSGVLGQRLVRKLCPHCKEKAVVKGEYFRALGFKVDVEADYEYYKHKGCSKCRGTGYSGRTALVELLVIDPDMRRLINRDCTIQDLKDLADQKGMKMMKQQGFEKVLEGITSIEEILAVAQDEL